jgi:hypothetical protein
MSQTEKWVQPLLYTLSDGHVFAFPSHTLLPRPTQFYRPYGWLQEWIPSCISTVNTDDYGLNDIFTQ